MYWLCLRGFTKTPGTTHGYWSCMLNDYEGTTNCNEQF